MLLGWAQKSAGGEPRKEISAGLDTPFASLAPAAPAAIRRKTIPRASTPSILSPKLPHQRVRPSVQSLLFRSGQAFRMRCRPGLG
jgi:hypothetical protein